MSALIKIGIWVIPVFFLIKYVEKRNPCSYLRLNQNVKKGLKWALWISVTLGAYFVVVKLMLLKNDLNLNLSFNVWLNHILLVGLTEEIVFRGFILRKLMEKLSFWKANGHTSLLFVAIHLPIWFREGMFESFSILGTMILVFIISVVFGFIYKRTNSLWSVILVHSAYDFFASVFN